MADFPEKICTLMSTSPASCKWLIYLQVYLLLLILLLVLATVTVSPGIFQYYSSS